MLVPLSKPLFFDVSLCGWDRVKHILTLMPIASIVGFDHEATRQNTVSGLSLHTDGLAQMLFFRNRVNPFLVRLNLDQVRLFSGHSYICVADAQINRPEILHEVALGGEQEGNRRK